MFAANNASGVTRLYLWDGVGAPFEIPSPNLGSVHDEPQDPVRFGDWLVYAAVNDFDGTMLGVVRAYHLSTGEVRSVYGPSSGAVL